MAHMPAYPLPNAQESAEEAARLDSQRSMWEMEFKSSHLAPISPDTRLVVEIGCGTGLWGRTIAKQHPAIQVIGVDLNPPMEGDLHNCHFAKANVEQPWTFVDCPGTVDVTYSRLLVTGIQDWQAVIDHAFHATKPGGYFESHEPVLQLMSDGSDEAKASHLASWFRCLAEFLGSNGVDMRQIDTMGQYVEHAGFKIVEERRYNWYLYPSNPEMKGKERISSLLVDSIANVIVNISPKMAAQSSTMSAEDIKTLAINAERDLRENSEKFGFYIPQWARLAQKPL